MTHKLYATIPNDLLLRSVNAFDLKKSLVLLVLSLPLRQNGDSSGAENVFRSQSLAVPPKPSSHSTHS